MQVDLAQLEPALHTLLHLDWIGQLDEVITDAEPRLVLLVDPGQTPLAPLAEALLLARTPETEAIWREGLGGPAGPRKALRLTNP